MKAHAELHFVVGITIKKRENAWSLCMVDVKEMPITFTPNQLANLSACNETQVSSYMYCINNLEKFIVSFSSKEQKKIMIILFQCCGTVCSLQIDAIYNMMFLVMVILFCRRLQLNLPLITAFHVPQVLCKVLNRHILQKLETPKHQVGNIS